MKRIKKLSAVFCAIVAMFSIVACGGDSENTITPTTVQTPTLGNEEKTTAPTTAPTTASAQAPTLAVPATGTEVSGSGYTLTFPDTWTASSSEGCDIVMYDASSTGSFTTNMNVVIEDVSAYGSAMTAETYCEAAKLQFAGAGYTVVETKNVTVNGQDAYTLICEAVEGDVKYIVKQLYVVGGGNAYVTTFSAGSDTFDKEVALGDSILATFKLK